MGVSRITRRSVVALFAVVFALGAQAVAFADGSEELGVPSIPIATGSGTVAAGVGLDDTGTGTINIAVPGTVKQALLYWEGQARGPVYDDQIVVNGNNIAGTVIGGPTLFVPSNTYSTTVRADITSLVASGPNSLALSGFDGFDRHQNGAGVLVIFDDGSAAEIGIFDGNDLAFYNYDAPLDTTVAKTFTFAAEPVDRVATLTNFASSVAESEIPGLRPSTIEITLSNGDVTELVDVLDGVDGNQWDTVVSSVAIPAGVTSVTVRVLSDDRAGTGLRPASLAWSGTALAVPTTPDTNGGGEGCTPGYWKQKQHFDSWAGYGTGDSFASIFGVAYNKTLLQALGTGGGQEKALGRHAAAALLNAANGDVDSSFTTAQVIALVQAAYASGDYEGAKNILEADNEMGCPLN